MTISMDPKLAAQLWHHRFRGALVSTIHRAGPAGAPEEDVVMAIARFHAATKVPLESLTSAVRSLYVDGLLTLESGRVRLGPNFAAFMKKWADGRAVAVEAKA